MIISLNDLAGIAGVPPKPAAGIENKLPLRFKEVELPSGEKKSVPIPQEDDDGEEEKKDKSGEAQHFLSSDRLFECDSKG